MAPRTLDRVGEWLEGQTAAWRWVDPEVFTRACVELEVWESWTGPNALKALEGYFQGEDALAASMRFLNVAAALEDDTLAEFVYDTDDEQTAFPTAIFWTAATAAYDDAEAMLEPRAWRQAIMACIEAES